MAFACDLFLSSEASRRKAKTRLRTMMPLVPLSNSRGIIRRGNLQKCLDCKHTSEIKVLFGARAKAWQSVEEKYQHQPGCISERKF